MIEFTAKIKFTNWDDSFKGPISDAIDRILTPLSVETNDECTITPIEQDITAIDLFAMLYHYAVDAGKTEQVPNSKDTTTLSAIILKAKCKVVEPHGDKQTIYLLGPNATTWDAPPIDKWDTNDPRDIADLLTSWQDY